MYEHGERLVEGQRVDKDRWEYSSEYYEMVEVYLQLSTTYLRHY